jgi:hypothetical protein
MTVGELVHLLSKLDQSLPVYVAGYGGDWTQELIPERVRVALSGSPHFDGEGLVIEGPAP